MIFDEGMQPERTALAWRRSALSLLVGSVAGARLLAPQLGVFALVLGVAGCGAGIWTYLAAGVRSRRTTARLLSDRHLGEGPHAGVLAATAGYCALLGASALFLVVDHGLRGILTSR